MRRNKQEKIGRQLNNKGFSLIELIVVIAIMALLVGVAALGIYTMVSGDTKRASKTISGEISSLRSNTLAVMGQWQYEIVNDNGSYKLYTYKDGVEKDYNNLGSRIRVSYKASESASEVEIGKGDKIIITFVQGSGKIDDIQKLHPAELNGASALDSANSVKGTGYCVFKMTTGGGKNAEDFKLYYETGKVIMD